MSQISSKFLSEAWVFGNVDLFIIISVLIVISSFILKLISKLSKKLLPVIRSMVSHYFQICWCAIKIIFGDGEAVIEGIVSLLSIYEYRPRYIFMGVMYFVLVRRPEDVQTVLNNSNSLEKSSFYRFFRSVIGEGLLTAPVPKWRKHRRSISPVFNSRMFENFFIVFNQKNKILVNRLRHKADTNEIIDLWNFIAPVTLSILCETVMGFDTENKCEEKEIEEFQETLMKVAEEYNKRILKLWLHPDFIFNIYSKYTGHHKKLQDLRKLPMRIIQYKKQKLKAKKSMSNEISDEKKKSNRIRTFLDTLLELNEQGADFSDQDLFDEVITMMIGGSETTAITNCFTLLMLAMHPHIQDEVYKEVISILGMEDKFIEMEDVKNMPFLEQCIKETMRLFPAGPLILREPTDNLKLSEDFTIKKGSTIIIPLILIHRSIKIYENPLKWDPNNFLPEEVEKKHKYSFLAFSGGPRGCVGSKYAILTMKMTISMIIKNYYITTDVEFSDIKLKFDLLLRSVNGYKVKLHSRKSVTKHL